MNQIDEVTFTIFIIFTGAAIFATLALYARQTLIVAYRSGTGNRPGIHSAGL